MVYNRLYRYIFIYTKSYNIDSYDQKQFPAHSCNIFTTSILNDQLRYLKYLQTQIAAYQDPRLKFGELDYKILLSSIAGCCNLRWLEVKCHFVGGLVGADGDFAEVGWRSWWKEMVCLVK